MFLCLSAVSPALFSGDLPALPDANRSANRGDYLTVKIAVMGPGDELYLWWGHIGLVVEDALSAESRFYDWGVFSFENKNFFLNFAFGRLLYSCAVSTVEYNINRNVRTNRDVTVYTLDLPPEKKLEIFRFAENNVLPENRDYWYHHFKDNCATRIRDIIDMATSGAFRARYGDAPGRLSLRGHVRRHTWSSPFWDWILNFWMGRGIDEPITVWDEMFLPSEIAERISGFRYTDSSGAERILVSSVEVLNTSRGRPPVIETPKASWPGGLALGIVLAAVAVLLAAGTKKKTLEKPFAKLLGIYQTLAGLFFGAAGFVLFFMMFFTNHDYTWRNGNVVFVNPLLLAAVPLGLILAFTKSEKKRRVCGLLLKILWTYVFLGGLFVMALNRVPGLYQRNQTTFALVLPLAFALSCIPGLFPRRASC
ncbi:MAG: DUF4105 domain-containing protein [Treponema sp.]|nr:DUF4105 domain-containing protein [Treponema sp.]